MEIILVLIALIVGVLLGGFAKSTKKRDREYCRALDRYLIDEERKCN